MRDSFISRKFWSMSPNYLLLFFVCAERGGALAGVRRKASET